MGNLALGALSGFIGAIIITLLLYFVKIDGRKLDIPYLIGSRFINIENESKIYAVGIILHLLIGAGWGVFYVFTVTAMSVIPDWPTGILWGFAHGIFIGSMMGIIGDTHPYIGEDKPISDPGIMGKNWGDEMPWWVLGIHIIFGVCTLTIYNWLAY